jgi:hypothetical protein
MTKETNAPEKPDNLALWNRLEPTDPKYTKQFDRGGFKGTATNGTYIIKRLTEEFGPCGTGWVFVLDDERVIVGHTLASGDKAQLHVVRGHIEYGDKNGAGDYPHATSPQFGQTMLVGSNKNGTFTDEEAPKKSITDCISKCAVLLGIAADVHLGLFDDSKYVNDRKREVAEENGEKTVHGISPEGTPVSARNNLPVANQPNDIEWARTVFTQVKGMVAAAKDLKDIDDALKGNAKGLKDLERISLSNYDVLKGIVTDRRKELAPKSAHEELNDDLPDFAKEIPA